MKLVNLSLFVGISLLLTAPANADLATAVSGTSNLTKEQIKQDLTYFRDSWVPLDRSFTPETRAQMIVFINHQISDAHAMDKAELALVLSEAAAFSGNDHTLMGIYNAEGVFHSLPLSFWWFPEGAMVTRAHPDYRR